MSFKSASAQKKIRTAFTVGIASLLVAGGLSYWVLKGFLQTNESVNNTVAVLLELRASRLLITDADQAVRDYVRSGDVKSLDPFFTAKANISDQLGRLESVTANNLTQHKRVLMLEQTAKDRLDMDDAIIAARRLDGLNAASQMLQRIGNSSTSADMRHLFSSVETDEATLLKNRVEAVERTAVRTAMLLGSLIILAMISASFAYSFGRRDRQQLSKAEDAAGKAETRLRLLLDSTAEAIYGIDQDGNCTFANPACVAALGYESDSSLLGRNMHALMHHTKPDGSAFPDRECAINQASGSGMQSHREDEYFWTKDGKAIPVEYWSHPLKEDGKLIGAVVAFRDISDRAKSEQILAAQYEAARALAESATLQEAGARIMAALSKPLSCRYASVWLVDDSKNALRLAQTWNDPAFTGLGFLPVGSTIGPGVGLAGRIWKRAEPVWIPNVVTDTNFLHSREAGKQGLYAAVGLPIILGTEVLGVITFFSGEIRQPDEELLKMLAAIGSQIGQFIDRERGKHSLEQANQQLSHGLQEMQRRSSEIGLLTQMGSSLQSCVSSEEAYAIITRFSEKLFDGVSGALFVVTASRNLVEAVALWGGELKGDGVFVPGDCWALRAGRMHCAGASETSIICRHVGDPAPPGCLCVPLIAQGDAIGILHLQCDEQTLERHGPGWDEAKKSIQQLASAAAEQIALALANLKLRETLRIQSTRDPLTGLFNRRYMEETLEREIRRAARRQRSLAAIMIDIDHFKRFNDTFGHEAGDTLLREMGTYLRSRVRGEDLACRYGGEEFILILPETTLEIAEKRAEEIREGVKHLHVSINGQTLGTITLSAGVAVYPDHGLDSLQLVRNADSALYQAKEQGRDRVIIAQRVTELA